MANPMKPGPQPHNRLVRDTFMEQMELTLGPRTLEPLADDDARRLADAIAARPELFAEPLMAAIGDHIAALFLEFAEK
jgi:hypothetical protein